MNKTKPKKFTFKNEPKATGLATVGARTPNIEIKYAGVCVGSICFNNGWSDNRADGIRISIMIPREATKESPCPWKWVRLKKHFESADAAKEFLNDNFAEISGMVFVAQE